MTMPFFTPPEEMMKQKAEFARKGIARGRALVAVRYADGILLVAENQSNTLRKISEIYDRIAFAGVGKYNEFDQLRQFGVRVADSLGFQYSRRDVEGRSLANSYAQIIGQAFTHEPKPLEVEILVAEVGTTPGGDRLFHITYDGTVLDETGCCTLGGDSDAVTARLREGLDLTASFDEALTKAVSSLAGPDRRLTADELEVAVLRRGDDRRCFERVEDARIAAVLGG